MIKNRIEEQLQSGFFTIIDRHFYFDYSFYSYFSSIKFGLIIPFMKVIIRLWIFLFITFFGFAQHPELDG